MATKRPTLRDQLEELQREIGTIKQRLDVLEKPKIARVVLPPRTEPGGAT
jgi:hypothetical protein